MKRRVLVSLAILAGLAVLAVAASLVWNPMYLPARITEAYLYQAGVREHAVMVDGHRIYYLESKPASGVPDRPLLLVHGLGASKADFAAIIVPLSRAGFHVYAPDLLGYGKSDAPKVATFSLQQEEDTVVHFMDHMNLRQPDVTGWSMGGWISMKLSLDYPERVRRLILLDSAGVYFPFDYDSRLFTPTNRTELLRMVEMLEPEKPFLSVPGWATAGLLRQFKPKQKIIQSSFDSMVNGRELLDFRLHNLAVPTLIVWGTEDKLIPFTVARRIQSLVEGSSLIGIRGCGHMAPGECSQQVSTAMIRFLKEEMVPPPGETIIDGPRR